MKYIYHEETSTDGRRYLYRYDSEKQGTADVEVMELPPNHWTEELPEEQVFKLPPKKNE